MKYTNNPQTAADHLDNVRFQLENVEGWLQHGAEDMAAAKSICLLNSAQALAGFLNQRPDIQPIADQMQRVAAGPHLNK